MSDQVVITNREEEAIYEYSDVNAHNISNQNNVTIEIFFSGGNRKIKIVDNGQSKEYNLKLPKKPESTPAHLLIAGTVLEISKDASEVLSKAMPIIIKRAE